MTRDGADHDDLVAADSRLLARVGRHAATPGALSEDEAHLLEVCDARLDVNLPLTPKLRDKLLAVAKRIETQELN